MNDSVRTKLQASANGQVMRKRQSPKRKPLKKKEQAQKPAVEIAEVEYETSKIEEHANVLFKPNAGPQTDFLAASEREVLYGGSAGGILKSDTLPPFAVMRQNKLGELLETR